MLTASRLGRPTDRSIAVRLEPGLHPRLEPAMTTVRRCAQGAPETKLSAMETVKRLVLGYVVLSVATVAAIVALSDHPDLVTDAVWGRGIIVAATSFLTLTFTLRAAKGSQPAFRRLRIVSAIILIAIAVIVALPGAFPVWFRLEQALCGGLVAGVVLLVNRPSVRAGFATE
jgi:hypothetical protein